MIANWYFFEKKLILIYVFSFLNSEVAMFLVLGLLFGCFTLMIEASEEHLNRLTSAKSKVTYKVLQEKFPALKGICANNPENTDMCDRFLQRVYFKPVLNRADQEVYYGECTNWMRASKRDFLESVYACKFLIDDSLFKTDLDDIQKEIEKALEESDQKS